MCILPEYFILNISILYVKLRSMLAEITRTEYFKIKGNTKLMGQRLDHAKVSWHHSCSERCYKTLHLILLLMWRTFGRTGYIFYGNSSAGTTHSQQFLHVTEIASMPNLLKIVSTDQNGFCTIKSRRERYKWGHSCMLLVS